MEENRITRLLMPVSIACAIMGCSGSSSDGIDNSQNELGKANQAAETPAVDSIQRNLGVDATGNEPVTPQQLDHLFKLMDENGAEQQWWESLQAIRQSQRAMESTLKAYQAERGRSAVEESERGGLTAGTVRWRVVNLLGHLGDRRAIEPLTEIALEPLPDPEEVKEEEFAAEYRIRARAIAGLERLGALESLQEMYVAGGVFRGLVAASLFEMGHAPSGVVELDPNAVMGPGDPTDFNPRTTPEQSTGQRHTPHAIGLEEERNQQ